MFIYPSGDKYTGLYEEDERVPGKGTFSVNGGFKLESRENPLAKLNKRQRSKLRQLSRQR